MDSLDKKLIAAFDGRVVRKDLLHRIKKGTNVPTFVLEFLLARYCASDDPEEIRVGMEAVLESLQDNYVRPDEANAAQSRVATRGRHRFIDKAHVRYVEKEKRHWAALENFNSRRIAVGEKFYRDNDRLLEGGVWAEATVAYNDLDKEDYAFFIEELRPIQLSRFDFERYCEGRKAFTRDEWMDVVIRSVGLEPSRITQRIKFHYIARLAPLVEANFNYIELGPRGTGKSYFFSEFSPYATLISGGQSTKAVLFYNNARKKVGLVGFWDVVAFDEVAGVKIKDPDAIQIMKDYMANGRFSRGAEVTANASMAFVGNIDHAIDQIVASTEHDLFLPLPRQFDLAVMDRFACYLPGWEFPKNSSDYLTNHYGFITDYMAEAFHYQHRRVNRHEEISRRARLGPAVEGRDEKGIKKMVGAFLKILHPSREPTSEEFEEYVAYAAEARRRVKEQMNKRKPDDEFANVDLSYFTASGEEVVVHCPESAEAPEASEASEAPDPGTPVEAVPETMDQNDAREPRERHYTIFYDDTGHGYDSIIGPHLKGAKVVVVEDPYIRVPHQIQNFTRFCETVVRLSSVRNIELVTSYDDKTNISEMRDHLEEIKQSLMEIDVVLDIRLNPNMHDREIRIDNGWVIKIGRGLDFYQKPTSWFQIGVNDLSLRRCLETKVDIYKKPV